MRVTETLVNATVVVLTVLALVSVGTVIKRKVEEPSRPAVELGNWQRLASGRPRIGPRSSKVTIVMFSDVRCVHCRQAWAMLMDVRKHHPADVGVVYRHYPVVPTFAADASKATECAVRAGKLTQLFDVVHEEGSSLAFSDSLSRGNWGYAAWRSGIADTSAFGRCMRAPDVERLIEEDITIGKEVQVTGVPTMFVNGTRVTGTNATRFTRVVQTELR